MNQKLQQIAQEILSIETLETRRADVLDFYDLPVWLIKRALEAAYQAGRAARKPGDPASKKNAPPA